MAINGSASYPPSSPKILADAAGSGVFLFGSSINNASLQVTDNFQGEINGYGLAGFAFASSIGTLDLSLLALNSLSEGGMSVNVASPSVVNLIMPSEALVLNDDGVQFNFANLSLTSASVDAFFIFYYACLQLGNFTTFNFDLSGTCAAPTSASLPARTALLAQGNAITIN